MPQVKVKLRNQVIMALACGLVATTITPEHAATLAKHAEQIATLKAQLDTARARSSKDCPLRATLEPSGTIQQSAMPCPGMPGRSSKSPTNRTALYPVRCNASSGTRH